MANHALLYKCPYCGTPHEVEPQHDDQVIHCSNPNCGKPFELELPEARPEQAPSNLIVPGNEQPPAQTPAAPAAVPAVVQHQDKGARVLDEREEKTVAVVKPAIIRRYPVRFLAFVLLTILGLVFVFIGFNVTFFPLSLIGLVFAAIGFYRLGRWLLWAATTNLTITNRRTILKHGMFNKTTVEVDHDDIDFLHVHKGTVNSFMHSGDLAIKPKGNKTMMVLTACPNPEETANLIRAQSTGEGEKLSQQDVQAVTKP